MPKSMLALHLASAANIGADVDHQRKANAMASSSAAAGACGKVLSLITGVTLNEKMPA